MTRRLKLFNGSVCFLVLLAFGATGTWAATEPGPLLTVLPSSHHQQFLSFALWDEEKSGIAGRSDGNGAWSALGGAIALLEGSTLSFRPQLVIFATIDVSFRIRPSGPFDFESETFDGRFGFAVESCLTPSLRLSVGLLHISGHAGDGIVDKDLIAPNVGDDIIPVRLVYDWGTRARLGVTFKPLVSGDPHAQWFGAEQFAEWFPWEGRDNNVPGSPFLSAGFEENGVEQVELTYNLQAGIYFGNHFQPVSHPTVRASIGYYHGWDPRLKYQQLKLTHSQFFYWALWVNF